MRTSELPPYLAPITALTVVSAASAAIAKAPSAGLPAGYQKWAMVTGFDAPVFDRHQSGQQIVGWLRQDSRVPARTAATAATCTALGTEGRWFETPGGFLCTSYGIRIGTAAELPRSRRPAASEGSALPYRYIKVTRAGAGRYARPTASPRHLIETQSKAFFLAHLRTLAMNGETWMQTIRGEFVLARETRAVPPPKLRGVALSSARDLPVGFVVGPTESVEVRCATNEGFAPCGRVDRFVSFTIAGRVRAHSPIDRLGRAYPAERVRVARVIRPPDGVPRNTRWVHVDLDQQVFVAYEGDTPRYAGLVSTGVPGHETPTGIFQTTRKYRTKTMRGPDDVHVRYRVEEIPWVMYYRGNFALHAAYWHEQFGNVRSHGCTNLAPEDARWIYEWDRSRMPPGWHANLRTTGGLFFYFTDEPYDKASAGARSRRSSTTARASRRR